MELKGFNLRYLEQLHPTKYLRLNNFKGQISFLLGKPVFLVKPKIIYSSEDKDGFHGTVAKRLEVRGRGFDSRHSSTFEILIFSIS